MKQLTNGELLARDLCEIDPPQVDLIEVDPTDIARRVDELTSELQEEVAALKEKLRVALEALLDCQIATDWETVHRTAKEALTTVGD